MPTFVARAPGRIGLAGGGTDIPEHYRHHGGAVVSLAVRRYAFVEISDRSAGLELVSTDHGMRERIPGEKLGRRMRYPFLAEEFLTIPKAVAWHFRLDRARIAVSSDLTPGGGLGSSSAVAVAAVTAASAFVGGSSGRAEMAELAALVEIALLRRTSGKQDPYASSYGGAMFFEFARDGSALAVPIPLTPDVRTELERRVLLFSNEANRTSPAWHAELARRCAASERETLRAMTESKEHAFETRRLLERGDVPGLARLLDDGWRARRAAAGRAPAPAVDRAIAIAKDAGAAAARPCGPGLGGTLLVLCEPSRQGEVRVALATQGWRAEPLVLDPDGAALCEPLEREVSV